MPEAEFDQGSGQFIPHGLGRPMDTLTRQLDEIVLHDEEETE